MGKSSGSKGKSSSKASSSKSVAKAAKAAGFTNVASKAPQGGHSRWVKGSGSSKVTVNHWASTGTIGTSLSHPKSGKTQMFRSSVSDSGLKSMVRRVEKNNSSYIQVTFFPKRIRSITNDNKRRTQPFQSYCFVASVQR